MCDNAMDNSDPNATNCADEKENHAHPVIKYIGPGQEEFKNFTDQAMAFLDLHLPKWRASQNATGYLIPYSFEFKNPDVSDDAIQRASKSINNRSEIGHRRGDEAEYLMYHAINNLVLRNIQAPFMAFRGLKMIRVKDKLTWEKIFPNLNHANYKDALREYDYLLIGPTIGILVIEVKGCEFNPKGEFLHANSRLPFKYCEGLAQLNSVNTLLNLLETYTGIAMPSNCVRKIIFAPNLDRDRYDRWFESLNKSDKSRVKKLIGDVNQLHGVTGSLLIDTLIRILDDCSSIRRDVYETYAPILAGISSLVILPSDINIPPIIDLDLTDLSLDKIITTGHNQLITQNPLGARNNNLCSLVEAPEELKEYCKVLFLSPNQQAAFNGPNQQFICGIAGTGKTILLQAKALLLLSKGDPVIIVAPDCIGQKYKQLFDNYGYSNYQIHQSLLQNKELYEALKEVIIGEEWTELSFMQLCRKAYQHLNNQVSENKPAEVFKWCFTDDHILIDDLLDEEKNHFCGFESLCYSYLLMAFAPATKVVWIACDLWWEMFKGRKKLLEFMGDLRMDISSNLVHLKQAMRYSENIFNIINYMNVWKAYEDVVPIIGHKIKGCEVTNVQNKLPRNKAIIALCQLVNRELEKLLKHGLSLNSIVIIARRQCEKDRLAESFQHYCDPDGKNRNGTLAIENWCTVSSLEWPVVIYAGCLRTCDSGQDYNAYRAMTRATMKLIRVMIMYTS